MQIREVSIKNELIACWQAIPSDLKYKGLAAMLVPNTGQ